MLRLGVGGKDDYPQALKQYRLAANARHRLAQYRMGIMREQGLGAPRNRLHAYAWYLLAATDGNSEASEARDELEKGMTEKEKVFMIAKADSDLEWLKNYLRDMGYQTEIILQDSIQYQQQIVFHIYQVKEIGNE